MNDVDINHIGVGTGHSIHGLMGTPFITTKRDNSKMNDTEWVEKRLRIVSFDACDMNDYLFFLDWFRDWIYTTNSTHKNFVMESNGRLLEAKRDGWHIPEFQIGVIRKYVEWIENE